MVIRIRNAEFRVDASEDRLFWNAVAAGQWEPQTFDAIDRHVPPEGVIVDVGCWIGPVTLFAAATSRRVLAVDPDPVAVDRLERNLRLNPNLASLVTVSNAAIAPTDGPRILNARRDYGASSSSLLSRIGDGREDVKAAGLTLERVLNEQSVERVDLLKIDIEGGEFDLIPTLPPLLKRLEFPSLLLSFHLGHLNEHLYRKRIRSEIVSRVGLKLEKLSGRYLFCHDLRGRLKKAMSPLSCYDHASILGGPDISSAELQSPPLSLGNQTLLFRSR